MRAHAILVVVILTGGLSARGQATMPGNRAWNVELGGVGQLISFNLEWALKHNSNGFWMLRVGAAKYQDFGFGIPHAVTWNWGKQRNYLEVGLGGSLGPTTFGYADASAELYYFAPIIGYRRHPARGFQFRVCASPFVTLSGEVEVNGIVGLSFGRVFNK